MSKFMFDKALKEVDALKQNLPKVLANVTQLHFNDSFRQQGWEGQTWATPQRKIAGTPEYKYPKFNASRRQSRAILVQSGALRRSVATSLKECTFELIRFVVPEVYAAVHNEGLAMKNGVNQHKRTFMADSQTLRNLQMKKINEAFEKIFQI